VQDLQLGLQESQLPRVQLILGLVGSAPTSQLGLQTEVSFGQALLYWLVERIIGSRVMQEHLCLLVGLLFGRAIIEWGDKFWAGDGQLPLVPDMPVYVPVITVSDRRYLSGPYDRLRTYDMLTGQWYPKPTCPVIEGISYNILQIATQEMRRIQQSHGQAP
jgi:hypothetical protein